MDSLDRVQEDFARNAEACGENPAAGGCLVCGAACGVAIYCGEKCRKGHKGAAPVYRPVAMGNSDPIEGVEP